MPMLDAYIPAGALSDEAEKTLLNELTDLLLLHEGADPTDERSRQIAWIFLHRPEVYVAGQPADEPRYRFVAQVPEGQYNDERRAAVTVAMTEALARAEGGRWQHPEDRVWVFTEEIPDGHWGAAGQIVRLPDIARFVGGERAQAAATKRIAERRRQEARAILEAAEAPAVV